MYKIIKNGDVLAMTEAPNYIRRAENGCLALCREEEAEGIAYNNQIFQLEGRPDLEGSSATVTLEGSDAGSEITKAAAAGGILFVTMAEAGNIDAATAGEHADLFSLWAVPVAYTAGQIRRHTDGKLYRCLLDHTSQVDWAPDNAPSLWVAIADPAEEWPAWSQPMGVHDTYRAGDKVSHQDKHWTSDMDSNVWEPGVFGWTETAEE